MKHTRDSSKHRHVHILHPEEDIIYLDDLFSVRLNKKITQQELKDMIEVDKLG